VKKLLLASAAGLTGLLAYKRIQQTRAEQDLWSEATDPVVPPTA